VLTDGLTEVTDRSEREMGLEGVEAVLAAHAREPIERLFDEIVGAARAHGRAADDQTLLLVRRREGGGTSGAHRGTTPPPGNGALSCRGSTTPAGDAAVTVPRPRRDGCLLAAAITSPIGRGEIIARA